jgi:hypothetical protein
MDENPDGLRVSGGDDLHPLLKGTQNDTTPTEDAGTALPEEDA